MKENLFVDWLLRRQASHPRVKVGIGDDAAVVSQGETDLVVATDLICDGVHFHAAECRPEQIGRKALAVNLSDMAAMAARPVAAFVSLLLPRGLQQDYAQRIMHGMSPLVQEFEMTIAGGDTNTWDGRLAVNVAVVGQLTSRGPLLRSGARPGDMLLTSGALGGSILGRHLDFTPRVREALLLHEKFTLSAGMDISDGLAIDLRRLTMASGCGAEIDAALVPVSDAARQLAASSDQALERALGDGEDFELLLAAPPAAARAMLDAQPLDAPLTLVGQCTAGSELWLLREAGRQPLPDLGYEHGD